MASAFKTNRGAWRVSFTGLNGKTAIVHLGKGTNKRTAETVRACVEDLLHAKRNNGTPERSTSLWLAGAGDDIHDKLHAAGLVPKRDKKHVRLLGAAFQSVIDRRRADLSHSGTEKLKQARARLCEYFGEDRDLRTITPADAKDFARKLGSDYATATASAHIRKIKAFFADCVDRGLIESSPFAKIKGGSEHNAARMVYVTAEQIEAVIEQAKHPQWRLLVALARYAGLRIPSEINGMVWSDIHWDTARMTIRSPKTRRSGKPSRVIPILPGVFPHLRAAFEAAPEGSTKVFTLAARTSSAMIKPMVALIESAGLAVWPKLFQNLRSSAETDLCRTVPLHVACAFIGNTTAIANKHYLQVTDEHFAMASAGVVKAPPKGVEMTFNGINAMEQTPLKNQGLANEQVAPAGVEHSQDVLGNYEFDGRGSRKGHRTELSDKERTDIAFHAIYQAVLHGKPRTKSKSESPSC